MSDFENLPILPLIERFKGQYFKIIGYKDDQSSIYIEDNIGRKFQKRVTRPMLKGLGGILRKTNTDDPNAILGWYMHFRQDKLNKALLSIEFVQLKD